MSNRTRFCYYLLSWAIIFGAVWVAVGCGPKNDPEVITFINDPNLADITWTYTTTDTTADYTICYVGHETDGTAWLVKRGENFDGLSCKEYKAEILARVMDGPPSDTTALLLHCWHLDPVCKGQP